MAITLLSGCSLRTVDQLYCLPKRSDDYLSLQTAINKAMNGMSYSAPISGENQQTVQMADLDGDGTAEYLLFAKGNNEKPLHILIFAQQADEYVLLDTIEFSGSAFEQVDYIRMSNGGYELVVGRRVSDQSLRTVSIYSLVNGKMEQKMTTSYYRYVCCDLDSDGYSEVLVLRPGEKDSDKGMAKLYRIQNGVMESSDAVDMSQQVNHIKRIKVSSLQDRIPAVYVASDVDGSAIVTDVYALKDGKFTNVSFDSVNGTGVDTLRNYYVYGDDIDDDGIMELPSLVCNHGGCVPETDDNHILRWYALASDGSETDKMYTYHNYAGGWYVELDSKIAGTLHVTQKGNSFEFNCVNPESGSTERLLTIFVLTGEARDEQAVANNRFVLYRNESTVYAAHLEVASTAYNMSKDSLIKSFHMIQQDWKTGET